MSFGTNEMLIVLGVVVLLFGGKKIPELINRIDQYYPPAGAAPPAPPLPDIALIERRPWWGLVLVAIAAAALGALAVIVLG